LQVSAWFGLWAPKGTPRDVIRKLNDAVGAALDDREVQRRLTEDLALELPTARLRSPEALGMFQRSEVEKWWPLIRAAGIKPE
jgi:tripartite-type tricarboxylate transporter receptor subunit TctC